MAIRLDVAAQVRSYLLFVGIGSTAVFGLLVLSTQSALSVIQLEKIQRSYTLPQPTVVTEVLPMFI